MISYAVTVCNEIEEIKCLLPIFETYCIEEDEIVIVFDSINGTQEVLDYITEFSKNSYNTNVWEFPFEKDFAALKNYLNDACTNPYIFNLDADELPNENLISNLKTVIEKNPTTEAFWVPRINTVHNLTLEKLKEWGWNVSKFEEHKLIKPHLDIAPGYYVLLKSLNLIIKEDENSIEYYEPVTNFPDYQLRFYQNKPEIRWHRKVHEVLAGYKTETAFPAEPKWTIYHPKEINRQQNQMNLYKTI